MVCHETPNSYTRNRWQLTRPLGGRYKVKFEGGYIRHYFVEAPAGMYTDLASVPKAVWSVVGPIGPHLHASIYHDFLFMAWTDRPDAVARKRDFRFANMVFDAAMRASNTPRRWLILKSVETFGWGIFKSKDYTLSERLKAWEKDLPK